MKKRMKGFTILLVSIMLISFGCSKQQEQSDVENTTTPETEEVENSTVTPEAEETEAVLYAADSDADDFEGYTELLAQYGKLQEGESCTIDYDFDCPEYAELVEKYGLKEIAGEGSEFERAVRLMDEFSPRLTHESNYDNHVEQNSLALLEYSLDNTEQGINCLNKTKILNEMCLALGIYARRVYIMPYSSQDCDNHVVSEVYDTTYEKWIMLDMTSDTYFVDENSMPLSVLEIREHGASGEFCTAISSIDRDNLDYQFERYEDLNAYIMKNMFYFEVDTYNGFGLKDNDIRDIILIPENFDVKAREIANYQYRAKIFEEEGLEQNYIDYCNEMIEKTKDTEYWIGSQDTLTKSPLE